MPNASNKTTFFVVEDHSLTNLGIRQYFSEHSDFSCVGFAHTYQEALNKLQELTTPPHHIPDVVILDLSLGQENGLDLLHDITARYSSIKVMVYSMYTNPGIVTAALENGAMAFVSKSCPDSELLSSFKKVAQGQTHVQADLIQPLFMFRNLLDSLTKQEQNILKKIIAHKSNKKIAHELMITERTVENYLSRIYSKTGCKNHEELIARFG